MYIPSKKRITSLFSHLVCALLILFTSQVVAQTIYPIRSIATLAGSAPYTLDEYVSQQGKLQVQIITDDVTLAQYAVKLRLTLESADVKITTSTSYLPQPIYLEGGMMEMFTATDLAPLFSVNNLTFEGAITKSQYQKVGKLPEGTYRIKVDVVDYYRNVVVSKTTSAIGMVYMTKAPKLSFPASGSEIDIATSPQVRFNWMTFHAINPDAEIVHRFRIWELQPANRNPYEIINAITPIYQEDVTLGANLTLSPDILLLIPGRTYVWQVQAVDLQNKVLYQNSGKSDAFTFRYGKSCITPSPTLLKVGTTETQIGWSGNINTQQYEVRYKIATDTDWKLATTKLANYTILAQTDNTNYQVNVTAVCGTEQSAPSQTLEFKTNRTVDYTCGTGAAQFDLSNKTPLPALVKYDEFKAADFIIEVTEATGSNGQFTGKGLALVPYLGFAKFKVEFDDITINTDRRMVAGEVRFVYDVATGMVIGLGASGTQAKEIVATDYLKDQYSQIITTTQEVKRVEVKDSTVTITLADGSTQKVTASKKGDTVAIITPSKTTAYVADTNSGMVYTSPLPGKSEASNSASVASASQTKQYGSSVTITPSKTQQFGFDVVGNGTDKPNSYFLKNKSAQAVAWKSLKAGANDYVDVTVTGASPDSLRYLRESGMATPSTALPKARQLLLTGSASGEEELLSVALSTTKMGKDSTIKQTLTELGALGLVSYDPLVREVIIVPVNAAQAPSSSSAIQTTLNTIFAPAVVSWKVTMASPLTVTGITPEGFSTTNLSLASRYTTDMKTVIKAYKATNNISSNTLVLFFVTATNADKLGYMPLTGNYGFIFNLGSNIELLAHELAHGAFNLKHTFSDNSFWRESGAAPVFKEKSTQNLMDYAGGTELWKYQWDLIHDPEMVVMGSLDEDEGAMWGDDKNYIQTTIAKIKASYRYDKLINVVDLPVPRNSVRSENIVIGYTTYRYIDVQIRTVKGPINPKNVEDINIADKGTGLYIDNSIYIFVPEDQLQTLKNYLFSKNVNVAIFVNGYDLVASITDDPIETSSGYWEGIDEQFKQRLNTNYSFYADGNKSITTSNHKTVEAFGISMNSSLNALEEFNTNASSNSILSGPSSLSIEKNRCYHEPTCVTLNKTPNKDGFQSRLKSGMIAGKKLVNELRKIEILENDEIDFICHSMGFAYAQGIIEVLKLAIENKELPHLIFNGYYILAPENPNSGTVNVDEWKQIWQYGSKEQDLANRPWLQDGVAPQAPINMIGNNRAYIPIDGDVPQGFTKSHSIGNYGWIFNLPKSENGYVTPKK